MVRAVTKAFPLAVAALGAPSFGFALPDDGAPHSMLEVSDERLVV